MSVDNVLEALYDHVQELQAVIDTVENADTAGVVYAAADKLALQLGTCGLLVNDMGAVEICDEWFNEEDIL